LKLHRHVTDPRSMQKLMLTRFNAETWRENQRWRETNSHDGCIYNAPVHITDTLPYLVKIFVVEMNNDSNQIMGIGRIVNRVHMDKKYTVYSDNNYNRFTYRGRLRIPRDEIPIKDLESLENRLFKGKRHLKRGQGITQVPLDVGIRYLPDLCVLFT
jgi:hypothetical protein